MTYRIGQGSRSRGLAARNGGPRNTHWAEISSRVSARESEVTAGTTQNELFPYTEVVLHPGHLHSQLDLYSRNTEVYLLGHSHSKLLHIPLYKIPSQL